MCMIITQMSDTTFEYKATFGVVFTVATLVSPIAIRTGVKRFCNCVPFYHHVS